MRKHFIASILLISSIVSANTTATFLDFPVSPKETALGGAFGAVDNDIDSIGYNPAGLTKYDGFGLSFLYNSQMFGNSYARVAIVHPAGFGMLGVSFGFLSVPFDQTFDFGVQTGAKSLNDFNLAVTFQRDIIESLSFGISAKMISMDLGTSGGARTTAAADIGLLYLINPKFEGIKMNIGAGVRNLGLDLKFDTQDELLPTTVYGAVKIQPMPLFSIYAEADVPSDMSTEFGAGVEFNLFNIISPRIGYRLGDTLSDFTAGLGISKEFGSTTLALDYGIDVGAENSQVIEVRIQRPALLEFNKTEKRIPYDGKNPTKIAISDLDTKNMEADFGQTASEWLRTDLSKSSSLTILDRENMGALMKEQQLEMTGITSTKDAVDIGHILNVQYMILGSISLVGSEYYVSLKVVNVSTGQVEASSDEVAGSKATIRLAVKKLAIKLDPAGQTK